MVDSGQSKRTKSSISQLELKTALNEGKQIYIFIEKNVLSEYETYLLNKENDLNYRYVDDKRIYEFIEEIKALNTNNNIQGFETASDITKYLKEQFAGLFQRFLEEQTRVKEVSLIKGLEKTAQTLNKLVNFLSAENKDQAEELNRILTINHPLVERIKSELSIRYNFYIEGFSDLDELLNARNYKFDKESNDDLLFGNPEPYYLWNKIVNRKDYILGISKELFDKDSKLNFVKRSDWSDDFVSHEVKDMDDDDLDLPF